MQKNSAFYCVKILFFIMVKNCNTSSVHKQCEFTDFVELYSCVWCHDRDGLVMMMLFKSLYVYTYLIQEYA